MSSSDEVQGLGSTDLPSAPHPGPRRRDEQLQMPGPLVLAVLIAAPQGRWSAELSSNSKEARSARAMLSAASNDTTLPAGPAPRILGLAVVESWRFVLGPASHEQTLVMMQASKAHWPRRSGPKFMEHRALAACQLAQQAPCPLDPLCPGKHWDSLASKAVGAELLQQLRDQPPGILRVEADSRRGPRSLEEVLSQWNCQYGALTAVAWPAWASLACAMASGNWYGDVSVSWRRGGGAATGVTATAAPTQPTDRMLWWFRRQPELPIETPASTLAIANAQAAWPTPTKRCRVDSYVPEDLIGALCAASDLKSQARLMNTAKRILKWQLRRSEEVPRAVPTGRTMRQARVRLDMACMLSSREDLGRQKPWVSFLACDASPQRLEIFASVERIVSCRALAHMDLQAWPACLPEVHVEARRLPLTTLGHGRQRAAEKTHALVHQLWLDHGGSARSVRENNQRVRQVLTDMGVEAAVAEVNDVVAECLGEGEQSGADDLLFPLAMHVPGSQHILDGVLRDGVSEIIWWKQWEASAKSICQWMHLRGHREALQSLLRRAWPAPSAEMGATIKALNKSCDRFAEWRWKTLGNVVRDLLLYKPALCEVEKHIRSASEISTKDAGAASAFLAAVRSAEFWARCRLLEVVVAPVKKFAAWLRGCPCHEAECISKTQHVQCLWKGCRGPQLWARIQQASDEMVAARSQDQDGEVSSAMTRMLGVLMLKFRWVNEQPYTIWRVDSPASAAAFIASVDEAIAAGAQPHRVSLYLAGPAPGSLRARMASFAAGNRLHPLLQTELNAYRACKLDDTWAESSHRDISRSAKSTTNMDMRWTASTYRLGQNIAFVESLDSDQARRFAWLFHWWKAIARRVPIGGSASIIKPVRKSKSAVAEFVYRYKEEALRDWKQLLGQRLALQGPLGGKTKASLELDFVKCVVVPGNICTVPKVGSQAAIDDAWAGALVEADSRLHAAADSVEVFGVLEANLRGRALVRTPQLAAQLRGSAWPILAQRYASPSIADVASASFSLQPLGVPEVLDAPQMAPWPLLYGGLRLWKQSADRKTCSAPESVNARSWEWSDASVPALAMLHALRDRGWAHGRAPAEHTATSPLRFSQCSPAAKPYLRCLLALPDLLSPTFPSLHSRQTMGYYACVRTAARPEQIPRGASRDAYIALLALQQGDPACIGQQALPLENGDASEEDVHAPPEPSPPKARKRKDQCAAQQGPQIRRRQAMDVLWGTSQGLQGVPVLGDGAGQHLALGGGLAAASMVAIESQGPLAQGPSGSTASSSGASLPSPPVPLEQEMGALAPTQQMEAPLRQPGPVCFLEGVPVYEEEHGKFGDRSRYQRYSVTCTASDHSGGRACAKKRNAHPAQTAALGDMEPLAYLGAWLRAAGKCTSRAEHMAHKPSPRDVAAYAAEMSWARPAE